MPPTTRARSSKKPPTKSSASRKKPPTKSSASKKSKSSTSNGKATRKPAVDKASEAKKAKDLEAKMRDDLKKKEAELEKREAACNKRERDLSVEDLPPVLSSRNKKQRTGGDREPRPFEEEIATVIRERVWKNVKFLPENEKEQGMVFYLITRYLGEKYPHIGKKQQKPGHRRNFIRQHKETMAIEINNARNYVVNNCRRVCADWAKAHNGTLPTVDIIEKCATRTIDLQNDVELEVYAWYWTTLIPLACANTNDWHKDVHFFKTIAQEKVPKSRGGDLAVTASNEAFLLTVMESYRDCWSNQFELKAKHPTHSLTHGKKGKPGDENVLKEEPRKMVKMFDPKYFAKFTNNTSGANKFGGWLDSGKIYYVQKKEAIIEARANTTDVLAYEKAFLDKLREKNGILGHTMQQHKKLSRAAARGITVEEPLPPNQRPSTLGDAFLNFLMSQAEFDDDSKPPAASTSGSDDDTNNGKISDQANEGSEEEEEGSEEEEEGSEEEEEEEGQEEEEEEGQEEEAGSEEEEEEGEEEEEEGEEDGADEDEEAQNQQEV